MSKAKSILLLLFAVAGVIFVTLRYGNSEDPPHADDALRSAPDKGSPTMSTRSPAHDGPSADRTISEGQTESEIDKTQQSEYSAKAGHALTKEHVPEPFLAWGQNVRLTLTDFRAILEQWRRGPDAFEYAREATDEVLPGRWWIEFQGRNSRGEPTFTVTDLNTFTDDAYQANQRTEQRQFDRLSTSRDMGAFSPDAEQFAYDLLFKHSNVHDYLDVEWLLCRRLMCKINISFDEKTEFDILAYEAELKQYMTDKATKGCRLRRSPQKKPGFFMTIRCD